MLVQAKPKYHRKAKFFTSSAVLSALLLGVPTTTVLLTTQAVQAQALEEIVVTAQRREQSLQDVPIAIDVYSVETIQKEGFNNLEELSAFAPAVFVNEGGDQGSDTFIRGFGTVGRNWANDSAIPLFLDNVNLGQGSMGAIGFMDVQRVEILKGPQPIHFGMNATGGAISIVSARPTREWDGYAYAEMGQAGDMSLYKRSGNRKLDAAVGGPITETLAFRLAGTYSSRDGHLRDAVTGYPMGYRNFMGGRLSLLWDATDNLSVYAKIETATQKWAGTSRKCRRPEDDYPNRFTRTGLASFADVQTDPNAMWLDFASGGTGWATPILELDDCGERYSYIGGTYVREQPTVNVRTRDTTTGFMDVRLPFAYYINNFAGGDWTANPTTFGRLANNTGGPLFDGTRGNGTGISDKGYMADNSQEPINYQLEFNYRFDNDIEIQWTNNYMDSHYMDASADRNEPYLENARIRIEDYAQKSTEMRIAQYGGTIEWMIGGFIQDEKLHFSTIDGRAEIRFGNRMNDNRQTATWSSFFGNITYNFMDEKMSLDAGFRYSHTKKDPILNSYNSSWIYDVTPCTGRTTNNPATSAHPDVWRGNTTDWSGLPVQNVTPADCVKGLEPLARRISASDAMFLVPSLPGRNINYDNLWFVPASTQRATPATWRGNYTTAVGMTPWDADQRAGEQWDNVGLSWDNWDPQVVLRYRPSPELSTYFKYATAFKAGAYDLGFGGSQPNKLGSGGFDEAFDELLIDPEYSETFEFGASGILFDGRARYRATLFRVDFDDLIATTVTAVGSENQSTQVINIGKQRAQGLELDGQYALSDQLQLGLNFSYLDSKFTFFPNANCTEHEFRTYQQSGCQITLNPNGGGDITNRDDASSALIDRAGQNAAYAPEFSFTSSVDYEIPFRGFMVDTGATFTWTSWYYDDFRTFNLASIQKAAGDLNLHVGIGDMNDKWRVGLALRNLLEPRNTFRPEFTSDIREITSENLRTNQVKSVALTFRYNFFD